MQAPPASRYLGLIVVLLSTLIYLAFPTRQYYWDGISFAINIENARSWRELFNVHHLIYNHIGFAEYLASGRAVRALYLLQRTNCVLGGVLIWLLYRLLRNLSVPVSNSAAWCAILGGSATFWKFTTDTDSYILANVFLVLAYLELSRSSIRGGLFHFAAMLMHQLSALFYVAGLVLLWRHAPRKEFRRQAAAYSAIAGGGILLAYAWAYRLSQPPAPNQSLVQWLTFHARVPFSFHFLDNAKWVLLGTARLFIGGKLNRTALLAGPVALLFLGLAFRGYRKWGQSRVCLKSTGDATAPLVVWTAAYIVFLFVWEPYNTFYRLFYLVPLIALLALITNHLRARPLAWVAAAMVTWNFLQFIYPNTRIENNAPLGVALEQQKQWPPGTGVIYGRFVPDLWTISYFNPQVSWIALERPDTAKVERLAKEFTAAGRGLYLDWTYLQNAGEQAPRFSFRQVMARSRRQVPSPAEQAPGR